MRLLKGYLGGILCLALLAPQGQSLQRCQNQQGQGTVADSVTPYIGGGKVFGNPPTGYEGLVVWVDIISPKGFRGEYSELLKPDRHGVISVAGRLTFKKNPSGYKIYEFKSASLIEECGKPIKLTFTTKSVEGVSFRYYGYYKSLPRQKLQDDEVYLEGVIRKYSNGQESSEVAIKFVPFIILE